MNNQTFEWEWSFAFGNVRGIAIANKKNKKRKMVEWCRLSSFLPVTKVLPFTVCYALWLKYRRQHFTLQPKIIDCECITRPQDTFIHIHSLNSNWSINSPTQEWKIVTSIEIQKNYRSYWNWWVAHDFNRNSGRQPREPFEFLRTQSPAEFLTDPAHWGSKTQG